MGFTRVRLSREPDKLVLELDAKSVQNGADKVWTPLAPQGRGYHVEMTWKA